MLVGTASAHAEVIDRVMAAVDGAIILQSDVTAATLFGLAPPASPGGAESTLDGLIERRLALTEVNRYAPPEPEEALVNRRLDQVRARFATPQAFDAALVQTGLTLELLARHLRDDLRIETYLRQRFGSAAQPSDAEILQYYREHEEEFTRGGVLRPFGEAYQEARNALIEERQRTEIRNWVSGLRRRASITVPGIVVPR